APGHAAGQTASATARATGRPTRRHAAGYKTNAADPVTGITVPSATPSSPNGRTSATLNNTLTIAVVAFAMVSNRCCPAPFRIRFADEVLPRTRTTVSISRVGNTLE